MKICDTEFVTETEGSRSRFAARGNLFETDEGLHLRYEHDGDPATLVWRQNALTVERKGKFSFYAVFRAGEKSALCITEQGAAGEIPVHTDVCKLRKFGDGYRLWLLYRFQYPQRSQVFRLKIALKVISEEQ